MIQDSSLSRLTAEDIEVGTPLPWDLYDGRGILIVATGAVIAKESQLLRLVERGAFRELDAQEIERATESETLFEATSPFEEVEQFKQRLRSALRPVHDRVAGTTGDALITLARDVRYLAWKHPDAALGALLLDPDALYTEIHPLMVAIISELIARRLDLDEGERNSICAAALSANVSMLDLQEVLAAQDGPLTEKQRRAVRAHPGVSVRLLESIGIDDTQWLAIIRDHHERLDGTGYPAGKTGDEIDVATRIVALADRYCAMVLPRGYRDGLHAQRAIREIFLERGAEVDGELASLFIKELGVYPPGSFVRIAMGEQAVVIKRGLRSANAPLISSYADRRGQPYKRPVLRDCSEAKAYAIHSVIEPRDTGFALSTLWGHIH